MSRAPFLITLLSVALGAGTLVALLQAQDDVFQRLPAGVARPVPEAIRPNTAQIAPAGAPKKLKRVRKTHTVVEEQMVPFSAEETAESQAQAKAIQALKDAKDEASREAATLQLHAALNQAFDRDLAEREKEFQEVAQRVEALRTQLEKRKASRQNIISVRLKTLIFNADGLGFPDSATAPETTVGPLAPIPESAATVAPAGTTVPAPTFAPQREQSKKKPSESEPEVAPVVAPITKVYWFFSDERPESIKADAVKPNREGHLLFHVEVGKHLMKELWGKLDKEFVLMAEGRPLIGGRAERGFPPTECYLRIPENQFAMMVPGVPYELAPAKQTGFPRWWVDDNIRIIKPQPPASFDDPIESPKAPASDSGRESSSNDQKQPTAQDFPAKPIASTSGPPKVAPVTKAYWFFSDERPKLINENDVKRNADGHLLLHVDVPQVFMYSLWNELDKEFTLSAPGHEAVRAQGERGFWYTDCYVRIPETEFAKMAPGVSYELAPRNKSVAQWQIGKEIHLVKPPAQPKSESPAEKAAAADRRVSDAPLSPSVPLVVAPITKVYWYFSDDRPKWIKAEEVKRNADGHLLMHVQIRQEDMKPLWDRLDKDFMLIAPDHAVVHAKAERGFWNTECYLRIPAEEFAKMAPDVSYELRPANATGLPQWWIQSGIRMVKPVELPKNGTG